MMSRNTVRALYNWGIHVFPVFPPGLVRRETYIKKKKELKIKESRLKIKVETKKKKTKTKNKLSELN